MSTVSSRASALCGTWAGIRSISPAWTIVVSPSSKKNFSAPEMMRENCSLRCEWRGTMPPFAMKMRASVASSPLIIWREMCELSFSCSSFSKEVAAGMVHLFFARLVDRESCTEIDESSMAGGGNEKIVARGAVRLRCARWRWLGCGSNPRESLQNEKYAGSTVSQEVRHATLHDVCGDGRDVGDNCGGQRDGADRQECISGGGYARGQGADGHLCRAGWAGQGHAAGQIHGGLRQGRYGTAGGSAVRANVSGAKELREGVRIRR